MKTFKTLISFLAILLLGATAYAQTDITPSRYIFSDIAEGPYSLDKQTQGGNPTSYDTDVKAHWNDGFITIGNPNMSNSMDFSGSGQGDIVNSYFQILNMGGEVGKVLCMKGSGSTFPYGVAGNAGFWLGWWNLGFNADTTLSQEAPFAPIPPSTTIRFKVVFNIHQNTPSATKLFDIMGYTYGNNNGAASTAFTSNDFLTEGAYDTTKWIACEYDYLAGASADYPLRFAFKMGGGAANTTLLIKSITMTANPTGTAVEKTFLTYDHNEEIVTALDKVETSAITYTASKGQLHLSQLEKGTSIQVYAMSGQLVHQSLAQDANVSIPLAEGIFVVKAGEETFKLMMR